MNAICYCHYISAPILLRIYEQEHCTLLYFYDRIGKMAMINVNKKENAMEATTMFRNKKEETTAREALKGVRYSSYSSYTRSYTTLEGRELTILCEDAYA